MGFSSSGFSESTGPLQRRGPPCVSPAPPQCPSHCPQHPAFPSGRICIPSPTRVTQPPHSSHFLPLVTPLKSIVRVKFGSKEVESPPMGARPPSAVHTAGSRAHPPDVLKAGECWARPLGAGILVEMLPKGQLLQRRAPSPYP